MPGSQCSMSGRTTPRPHQQSSRVPDNAAKDNIKVSVRIRPLSEKESGRGDRAVWAADGSGGVGLLTSGQQLDVKFAYDVVFDASSSNQQVFEQVAWPAIEQVLQGISGTVFAYGVTSSGKTHTMMGTPGDAGVVPRAIQALFDRISTAEDCEYTVKLSMMEIYCEQLNDLLNSSNLNLDVQECQGGAGGKGSVLVVKGLTEGRVISAADALALIQQGQENRKVASTAFNDQSSRSHTICRLLVEGSPRKHTTSSSSLHSIAASTNSSRRGSTTGQPAGSGGSFSAATTGATSSSSTSVSCTSAWLTLVDLAGSEGARAALSKDQQAEARDINRSLLTLGKVMYELAKGSAAGHLPFRDSLLTRLLKPSLTGTGAKVGIICNVTPAGSQSDETWNTLRFADGAKRIKITAAKNEALDVAAVVAQYQREVAALKAQLAALSGAAAASGGGELSLDVLHAIKETLDVSSQHNAADQLQDQAAQLAYLRECLSFAKQERDQLLLMNRAMTGLLVQQVKAAAAAYSPARPAPAAAAAAAAVAAAELLPDAGSPADGRPEPEGCGISGVLIPRTTSSSKASRRATRLRRCLSYESLEFYGQWAGSSSEEAAGCLQPPQQQQQPEMDEPGLECNAADAAEVQQLLRITSDELPECVTHGLKQQQGQQQQERQDAISATASAAAELPDKAPTATAADATTADDSWQIPAIGVLRSHLVPSCHVSEGSTNSSVLSTAAAATGQPPPQLSLSTYYSAFSSFGGLSNNGSDGGNQGSMGGSAAAAAPCCVHAAASGAAPAAAAAAPPGLVCPPQLVPCPIVFPCSRRTSKTLAVAAPGGYVGAAPAGFAAGWLGCVGLPVLVEGVTRSALCEVVEAHRQLAAQAARLQLLEQHLADKEALLQQARQLQQGQHLQLRLTITAADRALLRDKLAEAEQQLASYKAQAAQYEQELQDVFDQASQLYTEAQLVTRERDALAAQLLLQAQQGVSSVAMSTGTAEAGGAVEGAASAGGRLSRSMSRCSSGCSSPEPGNSRIPMHPGSPTRHAATYGGGCSSSSPTFSAGKVVGSGGSFTKSNMGSSLHGRKSPGPAASAAAASSNAKAAAAAEAYGTHSSTHTPQGTLSPRLCKLASGLPALSLDSIHASRGGAAGFGSISMLGSSAAQSPCASPRSLSRSSSSTAMTTNMIRTGPPAVLSQSAVLSPAGAAITARERDSKLRSSWSNDIQASTGGFNPICLTSPFHEQLQATMRPNSGVNSERGSDTGSMAASCATSLATNEGVSAVSAAAVNSRLQGTSGGIRSRINTTTTTTSNEQSRIPLPPLLKRPSKRMLQVQSRECSRASSPLSSPRHADPRLDRFLINLHGHSLSVTQEPALQQQQQQQQQEQVQQQKQHCACATATQGATPSRPMLSPFAAATEVTASLHAEVSFNPSCPETTGGAACSSSTTEAGVDAAAGQPAASPSSSDDPTAPLQVTQSVRSHPLELPDHVVANWSARSSEVTMAP